MRWLKPSLCLACVTFLEISTGALFLSEGQLAFGATKGTAARSAKAKSSATNESNLKLPPGVKHIKSGNSIEGTPLASKFVLANGLRVLILPDARNPVATLRLMLEAGSNREIKGQTGLAHFFEHMMFRKTKFSDEGHYDRTLSGIGGTGNAATSTDYVIFYSKFPGPALDKMLELESQRIKGLELKEPFFSTEKGAVISERRLNYENDPSRRASEILNTITQRQTHYEWLTIGAKKDVEEMSIENAKKFYETFYTPHNAIVTLGGPFEVSEGLEKVNRYFGDWKGAEPPKLVPLPADYLTRDLGKRYLCSETVTTQRYTLTYPSADSDFRSSVISEVFTQMLNDHPDGTFERRLVKNKLAIGFGYYKMSWQKQSQPMSAIFLLNKDQKLDPAEQFWHKAVDEVLKKPFDERFRQRILKQFAVSEAETAQKMTSLAENYEWSEFFHGDFTMEGKSKEIVKGLTQEDLRKWITANLASRKYFVTGVTPNGSGAPACKDLLPGVVKSPEVKK
jgi:predicted Zn-dependent peptidase